MKYAISKEGLAAMQKLRDDLRVNKDNIESARETLNTAINNLGPSIGEFEEPLNNLISEMTASLRNGEEAIEEFSKKADFLASEIEGILKSGL